MSQAKNGRGWWRHISSLTDVLTSQILMIGELKPEYYTRKRIFLIFNFWPSYKWRKDDPYSRSPHSYVSDWCRILVQYYTTWISEGKNVISNYCMCKITDAWNYLKVGKELVLSKSYCFSQKNYCFDYFYDRTNDLPEKYHNYCLPTIHPHKLSPAVFSRPYQAAVCKQSLSIALIESMALIVTVMTWNLSLQGTQLYWKQEGQ